MKSPFAALALTFAAIAPMAHAGLELLPGAQNQTARVMSALLHPILFKVTDSSGRLVQGAYVDVTIKSGPTGPGGQEVLSAYNPRPYASRLYTDTNGVTTWPYAVYGEMPGTFVLGAVSDYGNLDVTINIVEGARPARIALVSGSGQTVQGGTMLSQPFQLQVFDSDNLPMPRAPVGFYQFLHSVVEATSGNFDTPVGFSPNDYQATSDENGMVTPESTFTASIFPGQGRVTAECFAGFPGGTTVKLDIAFTVTAPPAGTPTSYQDMWWGGDSQNGWGMAIIEHDHRTFAVIYAYDTSGNPVWYVVPDAQWQGAEGWSLKGTLYRPTGSPFTAFDTNSIVVGPKQGLFILNFLTPNDAQLVISPSVAGVPSMQRAVTRMTYGDAAGTTHGVGDMWWGGASQSGWGISVIEHFGTLFSVWYTYGADGKTTWFVMPGGTWSTASDYIGPLYTTANPTWATGHYSPDQLTVTQAGSFGMHVTDPNSSIQFFYRVNNNSATIPLVREPF